jgi:adenylate cyclase
VYEVHCTSHAAAPFGIAAEILRRLLDVGLDGADQTQREKIAGRLLLLDPLFEEALPSIFALLGVADPERESPALEPEARLRKTSNLLRRLLRLRGDTATTVLLVDDAHWIDAESSAVVGDLVDLCRGAPFLLLANFRPEHRSPWLDGAHCHRLALSPLGDAACDDLLNEWLGADGSLDGLRARVRQRAQGNPFFIEELVRSFAASGVVQGSRGAYVLGRPIDDPDLPVTVQAVLAARIDRLNDGDKHLLQLCAVIGREFSLPVLRRVMQLSGWEEAADVEATLHTLVRERFVVGGARAVDVDYVFEHPLTHEVAYQAQLAERRARLHAFSSR